MHACLLSCKEARERESVCVCVWERVRERVGLSGGVLQTNWCNWPMKDLRSPLGTKTLRMPTEQGNRIRHLFFFLLFTLSSFIYFVFKLCFFFFFIRYLQSILNYDCSTRLFSLWFEVVIFWMLLYFCSIIRSCEVNEQWKNIWLIFLTSITSWLTKIIICKFKTVLYVFDLYLYLLKRVCKFDPWSM